MKCLIADLNVQVTLLSTRIAQLSEAAKSAISNKNRTSALAALRSKKLNETTLAQRSDTLSELEEVYRKIEQATDQVAIVQVMKASTEVLRNLSAEIGGADKVEDVVEGLRDEMDRVEEIGTAIEVGGHGGIEIDESVVDAELESLERQNRSEEQDRRARETERRLDSIGELEDSSGTARAPKEVAIQNPPRSSIKIGDESREQGVDALRRLSLAEERLLTTDVNHLLSESMERMPNTTSES